GAATLGPYTFLRLIIGVLGGFIVFRELPDIYSTSGVSLILVGCILSSTTGRSPQRTDKARPTHTRTAQMTFRARWLGRWRFTALGCPLRDVPGWVDSPSRNLPFRSVARPTAGERQGENGGPCVLLALSPASSAAPTIGT